MLNSKSVVRGIVLAMSMLPVALPVMAQEYPVKAIRFIAPNLPGGPTDILARLLGQKISETFGHPVVVENRAGAGGNIGTEVAAKTAPDGYTLVTGNNATFGANPSLYKKMPFDPIKDFAPIVLVATQPNILVVHPTLPVKNIKELIAMAKARAGQLNYAHSGIGANAHLAAELFKSMTNTSIEAIAYKSAAPALVDLMAGHTHMTTAGTPAAVINKLNAEMNRALQLPDVREKLAGLGAEIVGGTPKDFADHIAREIPKWAKVVKDANVHIE